MENFSIELTKDKEYSIIYQYSGWEGNFSGIYKCSDNYYSYFYDIHEQKIIKIKKHMILLAF